MAVNYHALAELNLDPKTESATLDIQVDPGRTIRANVIDPDGEPIADTLASGLDDGFSSGDPQPDFVFRDLRPRHVPTPSG